MHEFNDYSIVNVMINNKIYNLWVADTRKKQIKGLSGIDKLPKQKGMLFVYKQPCNHSFTMRKTKIPLKIIFLNSEYNIIDSYSCKPFQKQPVKSKKPFTYVIEI